MKDNSGIPVFFLGIIFICLTVLGSAVALHVREFSKQESSIKENNSKIVA